MGLYIKQVIVDFYGNEINENKSINLLGKKRERKTFNYLNDFLQKYYGDDDLSSISKSTINTHKKRKISDIEANKKCSTREISELRNNLPDIGLNMDTPFGSGKVISVNIFKNTYSVDVKDYGVLEFDLNGSVK